MIRIGVRGAVYRLHLRFRVVSHIPRRRQGVLGGTACRSGSILKSLVSSAAAARLLARDYGTRFKFIQSNAKGSCGLWRSVQF